MIGRDKQYEILRMSDHPVLSMSLIGDCRIKMIFKSNFNGKLKNLQNLIIILRFIYNNQNVFDFKKSFVN